MGLAINFFFFKWQQTVIQGTQKISLSNSITVNPKRKREKMTKEKKFKNLKNSREKKWGPANQLYKVAT